VLKVKVISVQPVEWAKLVPLKSNFWKILHANLKVVSVLKGASAPEVVEFIYRSDIPAADTPKMWIDCGPENDAHFKLEPQKCYILFVKKIDVKNAYVQVIQGPTMRPWEGFIQAADDAPVPISVTAEQAIWNELTKQLHSKNANTSAYAAQTLFALSSDNNSTSDGSDDFSRKKVLDLLFAPNQPEIAALYSEKLMPNLIESLGSLSPYSDEGRRMRYLWTRADKPMSRWSPFGTTDNTSVGAAVPYLIHVADGKHASEVRAKAICALGLCQKNPKLAAEIAAKLPAWLASADPAVRAAAVFLSTDYPQKISAPERDKALLDPDSSVRQAAALTAAMARSESSIPQLEKLIADKEPKVRGNAALALLAFPVPKVINFLRSNLSNPDFGVAFLCRLAYFDPASVKDQLLKECEKKTTTMSGVPTTPAQIVFQNGLATSPHSLAQQALLEYLDEQTSAQLSKPEFIPYLNCMEQFSYNDPSTTGRVYEILISHKLVERAASFKKRAITAQPTLPMVAFDQPDMLLKNGVLKYK